MVNDYSPKENTNRGFSLVELIICVAILAIAIIPLYRSMALSARTNAKAQSLQNATSLAESVMEEIKSTSVSDLKIKYNGVDADDNPNDISLGKNESAFFGGETPVPASEQATMASAAALGVNAMLTGVDGTPKAPFYVLYLPQMWSTQEREKFDVVATLRSSTYMKEGASKAKATDASDANIKKLPKIEEIDTLSQAVISSKEFARYDKAALDYFIENVDDHDVTPVENIKIARKEIIIDKENLYDDQVRVNCRVEYYPKTPYSGPSPYSRDLFSGTFSAPENEDGSSEILPFASNIYLFYSKTQPSEIITVNDKSTRGTHKVFLIMQSGTVIDGTTVNITDSGDSGVISLNQNSDLDENGNIVSGNYELVTNMTSLGDDKGHIYNEESGIRIYDVNVSLLKDGELITSVQSTKEVKDTGE